jgi:CDP-glucose 4,6-dehydratase
MESLAVSGSAALPDPAFWRGRRVLLTGHTGFKGAWAALWLERLGAEVSGFALAPETEPSLFDLAAPWSGLRSRLGDVRDPSALRAAVDAADPQIVIHMAAQALVRRGYAEPRATFETNVQGTANLLDALDGCAHLEAVLVVTTDKCYRNDNAGRPFVEDDPLGGADPYSASKAAQELVCHAWPAGLPLATTRAGNVIGGGDWAADRVLPDLFRAVAADTAIRLRRPRATRPWQHVLDVLSGYFVYAERLAATPEALPRALNFGPPPDPENARDVGWLVETASACLRVHGIDVQDWRQDGDPGPAEATALSLDPALAATTLGWRTRLDAAASVAWTAEWHARLQRGETARAISLSQLDRYAAGAHSARVT